jgi:hypothetical protein
MKLEKMYNPATFKAAGLSILVVIHLNPKGPNDKYESDPAGNRD